MFTCLGEEVQGRALEGLTVSKKKKLELEM